MEDELSVLCRNVGCKGTLSCGRCTLLGLSGGLADSRISCFCLHVNLQFQSEGPVVVSVVRRSHCNRSAQSELLFNRWIAPLFLV